MDERPGAALTIDELSAYLKIPKSTFYKLVREGKVPCQKISRHWRFSKVAIDLLVGGDARRRERRRKRVMAES